MHSASSTTSSVLAAGVAQPPSMSSGFSSIMAAGGARLWGLPRMLSQASGLGGPNTTGASMPPPPPPPPPPLPPALTIATGGGGAANPGAVSASEDDVILTIGSLRAFRCSSAREALFWLLALLSGGLLLLLCRWMPELHVRLRHEEVAAADPEADLALVTSLDGVRTLCPILALDPDSLDWLPAARLRARMRKGQEPIVRRFDWRYERFWSAPSGAALGGGGGWTRRAFDMRGRPYSALHRWVVCGWLVLCCLCGAGPPRIPLSSPYHHVPTTPTPIQSNFTVRSVAAERVAEGILDPEGRAAKVRAATYGQSLTFSSQSGSGWVGRSGSQSVGQQAQPCHPVTDPVTESTFTSIITHADSLLSLPSSLPPLPTH